MFLVIIFIITIIIITGVIYKTMLIVDTTDGRLVNCQERPQDPETNMRSLFRIFHRKRKLRVYIYI